MKKGLLISLLVTSLFLTGCNSEKKQKAELEKLATDYYENYMTGVTGISSLEVSLKMLKEVSEKRDYKFKALKNCEDSTKIVFTIEKSKIADKEYELFCK